MDSKGSLRRIKLFLEEKNLLEEEYEGVKIKDMLELIEGKKYHDAFACSMLNMYLPLIKIYKISFDENDNSFFVEEGLANINLIRSILYSTKNKYMYLGEEYQLVDLDERCLFDTRRALFVKASDIKRRFEITELK